MAYRRRYLSGQSATTVVIAEGAITSDKIVAGAVTHPKLAPGSVDSERVIDGSLKSEDIQDGQIKTVDLAPNAVTTEKILDGAVTTQKLEASIQGIARPLTPGVDTAEIQDGKVTLAKLAPNSVDSSKIVAGGVNAAALAGDAVETVKIKDANITLPKMAPDSIDNTVIKANTIRGTEIATGAVGVTELGTDSVEEVKIKDLHVTEPKINNDAVITRTILDEAVTEPKLDTAALSPRLIESLRVRESDISDDFSRGALSSRWVSTGAAGGSVLPVTAHAVEVTTGAVNGNDQRIDLGGVLATSAGAYPTFFSVLFRARTGTTYLKVIAGLWKDVNNHIVFVAEDVGGATAVWKARCIKAGASVEVNTGVNVGVGGQVLSIEILANNSVKFYIAGVEKAHIEDSAKIPTVDVEPRIELITRTGAFRKHKIDAVSVLTRRTGY